MNDYLILKLQGPMCAWGKESFEGLRPSELFPGRSALLGLLAACLGIDRHDRDGQKALASSLIFAVRVDQQGQKMTDYHTVKNAREDYSGLKSHETIQTWREYWQDACFTVAIWCTDKATVTLQELIQAVKQPLYTPVLGRRSCPISRPLFEATLTAESALAALAQVAIGEGSIYSEENSFGAMVLKKRDVPIIHQPRQFASRTVFLTNSKGVLHVPE